MCLCQIEEFTPHVRPAGHFLNASGGAQTIEPAVGVSLERAAKVTQVLSRMFAGSGTTLSSILLARNLDDSRRLVLGLTKRGIRVQFMKESLTFTGEGSPMATLLLSMLGAVSEFKHALIKERQREGIAIAKRKRLVPWPKALSLFRTSRSTPCAGCCW